MQACERVNSTSRGFERPAAVAAIFSQYRSEVWRLGDPNIRIAGVDVASCETPVGAIAIAFRSVYLQSLIEGGAHVSDLVLNDPARAHARVLADQQRVFRNHATSEWGYGVFDGSAIPDRFVECIPVESGSLVVGIRQSLIRSASRRKRCKPRLPMTR